jgi:AcrR family transcriptional regulator
MESAHSEVPTVLPRGRHAAAPEVVAESQRLRMLAAMASATAEKGYARVTVGDVLDRAGVSRRTFYEHFDNKQACFLAAYDFGVDLLLKAIDDAIAQPADDWLETAARATRRYLETLAASPDFARTFMLEVPAAGPEALARRAVVHERFADQLAAIHRAAREDIPELQPHPPYVFRACVGAINELVMEHLADREAGTLPVLTGPVLEVVLALLVGRELSARAAEMPDLPGRS